MASETELKHLENRIDDLSKYKVSTHEFELLKKNIDEIHLQIAFINGQLKVLNRLSN